MLAKGGRGVRILDFGLKFNLKSSIPLSKIELPHAPSKYFPGASSQNLHIKTGDNPHT